jgi:AcrR family transcriptional regulator
VAVRDFGMRDKAKDEAEKAVRRQRAMESGFRLFSEKGIDQVTMPDIAEDSGVARPSLYRYFSTKVDLVIAIGTWKWEEYFQENALRVPKEQLAKMNAREYLEFYLDSFLDLYRNHRDMLRFNHFFNSYVENEHATAEQMR